MWVHSSRSFQGKALTPWGRISREGPACGASRRGMAAAIHFPRKSQLTQLWRKRDVTERDKILAAAPLRSVTMAWYTCLSLLGDRQRLALPNNGSHCTDSSHSSPYWLGSPIHQHLSEPIIYTALVNSHRHNMNHGTLGLFWSVLLDTQSCLSEQQEMTGEIIGKLNSRSGRGWKRSNI